MKKRSWLRLLICLAIVLVGYIGYDSFRSYGEGSYGFYFRLPCRHAIHIRNLDFNSGLAASYETSSSAYGAWFDRKGFRTWHQKLFSLPGSL
jgi:hypothetical protein